MRQLVELQALQGGEGGGWRAESDPASEQIGWYAAQTAPACRTPGLRVMQDGWRALLLMG